MRNRPFAIVDIETTGMNPLRDRIVEIAVIRADCREEYSTLVNPGRSLPPFITALTGIGEHQLVSAPSFSDIALDLAERLDDAVFVAHNARFDYAFIRNEFSRLGMQFSAPTLCTVRLSRKLYPKSGRHSLERIIDRHGISVSSRHRALDDARAVAAFLEIARSEKGEESYSTALASILKIPSLPAAIPEKMVQGLPQGPGVYIFYGDRGEPLYVGKSVNVRERVLSHFAADHGSQKEMALAAEVRSVEGRGTPGELSALLLEAELVGELAPPYNRRLQKRRKGTVVSVTETDAGYCTISLDDAIDINDKGDELLVFSSRRAAEEEIALIARAYQLCPKLLGIERGRGKGACFSHQLKRCLGACAGLEKPDTYNRRFRDAISYRSTEKWPYPSPILISERGDDGRGKAYAVDRWAILATMEYDTDGSIISSSVAQPCTRESSRILQGYLRRSNVKSRVRLLSQGELATLLAEAECL